MLRIRAAAQRRGLGFELADLMRNPTVAGLAERLVRPLAERSYQPFELVSEVDKPRLEGLEDAFPTSRLSLGLLFHSRQRPDSSVYHDVFHYRFDLAWDEAAFRHALDRVVAAYPALRSSFDLSGASEPLQLVHTQARSEPLILDLRGNPEAGTVLDEHIRQRRFHRYSLQQPGLFLFAAFVLDSLRGVGGRERFESSNVAFAAQAVGLETMRAASAFEDPHMRLRNGRLIRLSSEFMAMNTRFHALHQLLERLRAQGSTQVLDAFEPCLEEITGLLEEIRGRAVTDHDAERFAQRLADCRERLMARIRQARGELLAREPGEEARLDFNTAAELLYRFAEEMHDYALTHASLAAHRHEREQWKDAFTAKANAVAAAVAGMRTGLMILLFGCFWIYSTWPSGGTFALNAVAVSALASAAPNPKKVAMQMAIGTMAAALLGFSEMFFVYPHIDGFPLLCLVLAPVFALGAFISSRPQWAGYGLGLLVFFCFGSVPANLTVYDPAHVINEYIALILSMLLSAAAAAVILPPNSAWLWKRLERDLRMRVVFAISGRSRGLGSAFESGTRDLLNQAYGVAAGRPDVQRGLLRWMFLVLEVGHAIIELRREQERLPDEPCYAEAMPWRQAIRAMGRALIRLFVRPGAENLERALAAVDQAIHAARHTDEPCAPHFDSSPLRRVRSYLHFIRSSLLAPTSPLTELAGRTSGQGTVHAS